MRDEGLDPRRRGDVELVPPLAAVERADILRDAIDEHAREHNVWSGQMIADEIGHCLVPQIRSGDAERDLATFAGAARGAVLLANRYDGIDLPDDACRLVVLTGLPAATHLQERFLHDILGARRVLAERIRTRIVQGAGRCTRNVQDYAAVIVRGARLSDFCSRDETLRAMHPELQAEFRFGLDNSESANVDLLELLDSFLSQDGNWLAADADIRARAAEASREQPATIVPLLTADVMHVIK